MKLNKLFILLATFSMTVTGCNLFKKKNLNSSESMVEPSESSSKTSSSQTPSSSQSEVPPESSSSEPDVPVFPDPVSPLTPPEGIIGFPSEAINSFLTVHEVTDLVIPAVAEDQTWGIKSYESIPILKIWTRESTRGTLYEDVYYSTLTSAEITFSEKYYNTIGYTILDNNGEPQLAFKSLGDYFVMYICAPNYDFIEIEDGSFPWAQLDEYFDLMNIDNVPYIPMIQVDSNWRYKNRFYIESNANIWKMLIKCTDPNTPNSGNYNGHCLEDDYKELLEQNGWEIDDSDYDFTGYFATKEWVTIQFFSWTDSTDDFRVWIYPVLETSAQ